MSDVLAEKVQVRRFRFFTPTLPALGNARFLLACLLLLSFLPARAKAFLHTRGPLHPWAHVYLFTAIAVLHLNGLRNVRQRAMSAISLAALGLVIELVQARLQWGQLEVTDVWCDLFGVSCGALLWWLRSATGDLRALAPRDRMRPATDPW